eukprot:358734-Chlamydomonas_euryale.AAC.3
MHDDLVQVLRCPVLLDMQALLQCMSMHACSVLPLTMTSTTLILRSLVSLAADAATSGVESKPNMA